MNARSRGVSDSTNAQGPCGASVCSSCTSPALKLRLRFLNLRGVMREITGLVAVCASSVLGNTCDEQWPPTAAYGNKGKQAPGAKVASGTASYRRVAWTRSTSRARLAAAVDVAGHPGRRHAAAAQPPLAKVQQRVLQRRILLAREEGVRRRPQQRVPGQQGRLLDPLWLLAWQTLDSSAGEWGRKNHSGCDRVLGSRCRGAHWSSTCQKSQQKRSLRACSGFANLQRCNIATSNPLMTCLQLPLLPAKRRACLMSSYYYA